MAAAIRAFGIGPIGPGIRSAIVAGETCGLSEKMKLESSSAKVISGDVVARLGVLPQNIAGGDTNPALKRGTIDGDAPCAAKTRGL
ncbi:hypothetical protein FBZ94_10215 [Bradyrhizobium sacchari]|uniref:Uncharacterized protein n=1 Tax=Bradyrhizobium sacchari TaxID=1399419 RepID=A0A560J133_9BRAD|nr:hypothetical protein FBZ94_10215 [Bradyrhizobium sacchari]TWB80798.1 hypothetical protein FBZ95_10215 [Bradyrhizobium sacchari]